MFQQPKWEARGSAPPTFFSAELPDLITEVLYRRGQLNKNDMLDWLSPSLQAMRSPFSMKGVDKAVERLIDALKKQEKILVYGDYDMDGTPGVALGLKALADLGFQHISYFQPDRFEDGYGLHPERVEEFHKNGIQLILTVDVGITAFESCSRARELGVDILITDHHLAAEKGLPDALAIVNPNQGSCSSGLGHLCGTGVLFYLCLALKSRLMERGLLSQSIDTKKWLDCFTIATLTDMVPLKDENRVLVKHGLIALAQTPRVGLRKLMDELNLSNKPLSAQDVAIRLAPKLNALSRMGSPLRAIDLFLTQDERDAERLVEQVLQVNKQRKERQQRAEEWALSQAAMDQTHPFIWLCGKDIHPGVLGLVATRMAQTFGKPSFIASENQPGQLIGSARVPEAWPGSLVEVLTSCKVALKKFGGHAQAAGFELDREKSQAFAELLQEYSFVSHQQNYSQVTYYDAHLKLDQLNGQLMQWLDSMSPFGHSFDPPVFLFSDLKVQSLRSLSGGHLKLRLSGDEAEIDGLLFSPPQEHPVYSELSPGCTVHVLAEPQWNYFAGRKTLQLLLMDIQFSNSGPINAH